MTTIDKLKAFGSVPFHIKGYRRSDGSVVNLRVRFLTSEDHKQLIRDSIDLLVNHGGLLDNTDYTEARENLLTSLQKSIGERDPEEPKRTWNCKEDLQSMSPNLSLLDGDPAKVVAFHLEIQDTETLVEPTKVVKSRDELSATKKKLTAVLPIGRFCFRLNLYEGQYDSIE